MLTLQRAKSTGNLSRDINSSSIEELISRQWLLSNSRGGYSSSTLACCNTSRYHGLLVGSLTPPVRRIMALSHCLEMIVANGDARNISTFEFDDRFWPEGYKDLKQFRQDVGVHFDYESDGVKLTKSVYLADESDTIAMVYQFTRVKKPIEFVVRPFAGLRDFHSLQKSYAPLTSKNTDGGVVIRHNAPGSCELFLYSEQADFDNDPQWWFNFEYRSDKQRGQGHCEDLWSPGFFKFNVSSATKLVIWANVGDSCDIDSIKKTDVYSVLSDLRLKRNDIMSAAKTKDKRLLSLCKSADAFVTQRNVHGKPSTTILAGFPWFADWGRDAFISLPGLLLETGRISRARSVLVTFASHVNEGMIPNRFDDYSNKASFNSIDASLWFVNASFEYLDISGDFETFEQYLLPAILQIVDSYQNGTRYDIHADKDGLITGGNAETQLTWMDAKHGGVAFTPRYGKAVEINALWYNCLCRLGHYYADRDLESAKHYHQLADKVEGSFTRLFWNEESQSLNDCVLPDGSVDCSLRPNQIFAVSLEYSPLSRKQRESVVSVVERELLTPYGLRSLSRDDKNYHGHYIGGPAERDEAYHQGTVWAFLIGAFVEAYLKVHEFSSDSKLHAGEIIEPLMQHFADEECLGSVSEIFDGDAPHKARGCFAQAWSVGELIRAYRLIND